MHLSFRKSFITAEFGRRYIRENDIPADGHVLKFVPRLGQWVLYAKIEDED
ncbi:MAG: hypothetical protein K0S42_3069 [Microvirga sp.]|jgi:hypothetical protein|nr:hypothetical protein [Microvirga sp.]